MPTCRAFLSGAVSFCSYEARSKTTQQLLNRIRCWSVGGNKMRLTFAIYEYFYYLERVCLHSFLLTTLASVRDLQIFLLFSFWWRSDRTGNPNHSIFSNQLGCYDILLYTHALWVGAHLPMAPQALTPLCA